MANSQPFDIAIVGGGIAGLSVALRLPQHMRIALFTKGQLGESNTRYAQGGLAVALGADDSPELHFQDTLAAGAGLCDEEAVRILVEQAPEAVRWLIEIGVQFDRAQPGSSDHATPDGLLPGREGAHSRWRVLHAGGDATGAAIERALMLALRARSSVSLYEETCVEKLLPVAPAAHYCMGGVMVDSHGRTTLPGLYAVGEVSCTGVHGANRLASNSLLEGLVYGVLIADWLASPNAPHDGQAFRKHTTLSPMTLSCQIGVCHRVIRR